ncbi:DapH/DapD/GlmU-related protein [Streptococcus suis]|uniref:DapH/DapD/GlmU-related protein n=1 Tax=Streptococcus suis TaxID=1307 RepID=UPI000C19B246|nr:DapH/DapD/GlmU-related protein [Streptococcus suis]
MVSCATLIAGKRVFFNSGAVLRCHSKIEIGDDTMFGDGVKLYDFDHKFTNYPVEKLAFKTAPIKIGKNCWIGANSVILKGVTIGDNVIIGAGCTIHKDIPSNSIVTSSGVISTRPRKQFKHHLTTFTASDRLEHLEFLIKLLPEVAFHILAGVFISPYLDSFRKYKNVNIYSAVNDFDIEDTVLQRTDIYLDINYGPEIKDALNRTANLGKPIYSFDTVTHNPDLTTSIFSSTQPEKMVQAIQDYFKEMET